MSPCQGNLYFWFLTYIKWQGGTFVDAVKEDTNPVFKYTGGQLELCKKPPKVIFVGDKLLAEIRLCSFWTFYKQKHTKLALKQFLGHELVDKRGN